MPASTPSPSELLAQAQSLRDRFPDWLTNRNPNAAQVGRENPLLPVLLKQLYPNFERPWSNDACPVAVFPAPPSQVSQPDSVLGTLTQEQVKPDPHLAAAGQKYVELLQARSSYLHDSATYSLVEMKLGKTIKLDCALGRYFDAVRTCDALEWELLASLAANRLSSDPRDALKQLKLRGRVHALSESPMTRPVGRDSALAISTTVIFRGPDGFSVLAQRRAAESPSVHAGTWHVVPSGMFQPVADDRVKEFSVTHGFFREYLEELFRAPEAPRPPTGVAHDYYYDNPNLVYLQSLLSKGSAAHLFTGMAISLMNFRAEICTLLFIDSPEWYQRHSIGAGGLSRLGLNEDEWQAGMSIQPLSWIHDGSPAPTDSVPPGVASLWLAVEMARKMGLLES